MGTILKALYDHFYTKPKRKLVLRIINDDAAIASALSLGGFLCGFRLAWQMANELNGLENGRRALADVAGRGAHFVSEEGKSL